MSLVIFFLAIFFIPYINPLVVGSNTAVSREGSATFPAADSDNEMRGFGAFESGFLLENATTLCTFDSSFPVSGGVNLGGGKLVLNKDLVFKNDFHFIVPGRIEGNNKTISFPKSVSALHLPCCMDGEAVAFNDLDTESIGASVDSVDWSYDNSYVAMASDYSAGQENIEVYSFNGSSLSYIDGDTIAYNANSIRWHPSQLFFVVVIDSWNGGDDIFIYQLSGGSLSRTDGDYLYGGGFACAWHSSGDFIVSGGDAANREITLWGFNDGTGLLSELQTIDISPNRHIYALSFSPDGDYLAIGSVASGAESTLLIYYFNGSTLTYKTGVYTGTTVNSVDWSAAGYIAVGMAATTESLRVYSYDVSENSLTEHTSARIGELAAVKDVHWDVEGDRIIYATSNGASSWYETCFFHLGQKKFFVLNRNSSATGINGARWSPDEQYMIRGNDSNQLIVSEATDVAGTLLFDDTTLVFQADTIVNGKWKIKGNCKVVGNGQKISFYHDGGFELCDGATLHFSNVRISDVHCSNICCLTDNATITFEDSILHFSQDFTFSRGALVFERDVVLSGTVAFNYQSSQASTIAADSTLYVGPDVTFKYEPIVGNKNLIVFEDETSRLYLDGATLHATYTGLKLSGGMLLLDNKVTLSSDARNSGEACEFASDLNIKLLSGAVADVHGIFKYV